MKNIFFLAVFTLQFSSLCFSQSVFAHHYTEAEIKKFSAYIRELENKNTAKTAAGYNLAAKEQVDQLLDCRSRTFTDREIVELAEYIKALTKANEQINTAEEITDIGRVSMANDSLKSGGNGEAIELTNEK